MCFATSFSAFYLLAQHPIYWMPKTEDKLISRGVNEKPWLPQRPYSLKVTCCTQRFPWGIMWSPLKPRVNAGKFNCAPIPINCYQLQALESPMVNRLGFGGFFKSLLLCSCSLLLRVWARFSFIFRQDRMKCFISMGGIELVWLWRDNCLPVINSITFNIFIFFQSFHGECSLSLPALD